LLLLSAAVVDLAATRTGVGEVLALVLTGGSMVWAVVTNAFQLLWPPALIGILVVSAIVRRDRGDASAAGCLLGMIAVVALMSYGYYLVWPEAFRVAWDEFAEPFRYIREWFS
jgi:hypothetical protein